MISLRSSEVCFSPRSRGSTPNSRTIPFETFVSAIVNGALATSNQCSGRASSRATRSALVIARIFGTCSPTVMWSEVASVKASTNAIGAATAWLSGPSSTGSNRSTSAGSPRKPIPIEAIVIPTWQADSDSSIVSICSSACAAPASPSRASVSIRPLRVRTSANSAATKSPLRSTSRTSRTRKSAVTAAQWGRMAAAYFGGGRPRGPPEGSRGRGQIRGRGSRRRDLPDRGRRVTCRAWTRTQTPYLDALVAYADRDPGRFHVPGHKGGPAPTRRCARRSASVPCGSTSRPGSRASTSVPTRRRPVPARTATRRRRLGREAQLVLGQRRLGRQPRDLPGARPPRANGWSSSETSTRRPSTG